MPQSPGIALWIGPDGGPFTVVGSSNALPVTANAGTGAFTVQGTIAQGSPPSGPAVLVGGFDGTNVQDIKTDTSGRVVNAPAGPASNGLLVANLVGVAASGSTIKATSGVLYGLNIIGLDTVQDMFIGVYNAVTGSVSLGTTTPILEFLIARYVVSTTTYNSNSTVNVFFPWGIPFSSAITVFATTTDQGGMVGGSTGVAASKVRVNGLYI